MNLDDPAYTTGLAIVFVNVQHVIIKPHLIAEKANCSLQRD